MHQELPTDEKIKYPITRFLSYDIYPHHLGSLIWSLALLPNILGQVLLSAPDLRTRLCDDVAQKPVHIIVPIPPHVNQRFTFPQRGRHEGDGAHGPAAQPQQGGKLPDQAARHQQRAAPHPGGGAGHRRRRGAALRLRRPQQGVHRRAPLAQVLIARIGSTRNVRGGDPSFKKKRESEHRYSAIATIKMP